MVARFFTGKRNFLFAASISQFVGLYMKRIEPIGSAPLRAQAAMACCPDIRRLARFRQTCRAHHHTKDHINENRSDPCRN